MRTPKAFLPALRRRTRQCRRRLRDALKDAEASNRNLLALNERLLRCDEARERLLDTMRCEINNPLGDILALARILADPGLPAGKVPDLAGRIQEEAFRLDCELRDVFAAAAAEAGESGLFVARVDVPALARDILASYAPAAHTKGLALNLRCLEGAAAFPTDGEKLHHVLGNLVRNAVESGARGAVDVAVSVTGGWLSLEVTDHRPGLSPEERSRLFEAFHPAGSSNRGIGLSVAAALVDILGGRIQVESGPGLPTTFRVLVPPAPEDACFARDLDGNTLIFGEPGAC